MPRFRLLGVGLVWSGLVVPRWREEARQVTSFNNFVQPTSIDYFSFRAYGGTLPSNNSMGGAVIVTVLSLLVYM